MAWTAPRTWVAGEVVTAALGNTHWRDNLRYLKGLDGVPTIESGLTIDNTDGDERLLLPLLSTAECATVLNAAGEVAYDEQTNQIKEYDGTAVRAVISEADVDDTPVNGATTVPVSSNWAYDHINILTTAGDIVYATGAGVWARLALGTPGYRLRVNAGGTAPEWGTTGQTQQFFTNCYTGSGGALVALGDGTVGYSIGDPADIAFITFRVPADFTTLTTAKLTIIGTGTGTIDWTIATQFGAAGESYAVHTDSLTVDGEAITTGQVKEIDISAAYTGLAANDIVGTEFTLDALATTSNVHVVGIDFKYT